MKVSLRLRIFLYHLVFIVALGALLVTLIRGSFERYAEDWEQKLRALPAQRLFSPLVTEVGRSLLLELEGGIPEVGQERRSSIGEGLDAVIPTLRSVESLAIVDRDGRVQYSSSESARGLIVDDPEIVARLPSGTPSRREIALPSGQQGTEVILPVFGDDGSRLGAVVARYRAALEADDGAAASESAVPGDTREERLFGPLVTEVSRSLLLEIEPSGEEAQRELDDYRYRVSDGLRKVMRSIPSVEALVVVDRDHRIHYVSSPEHIDLTFVDPERLERLDVDVAKRWSVELASGEMGVERAIPIFDEQEAERAAPNRLGTILVRYRPDPELAARLPQLQTPILPPGTYIRSLGFLVAAAVVGGVLLTALAGLPVKRLERALADFRARDYKGGLDIGNTGLERELGPAVQAINELGGRVQALDARGREREALLATLSQSLEEGMVALDPDGTPVAWNPAAARLLLGSDDESGDRHEALREAIERNTGITFALEHTTGAETLEVEVTSAAGELLPARVTLVPFEVRPGETGTLVLLRDLATLRKVEAHLLEAGRFAVLAHLAAGLAHEIRNPLHSIRINATAAEQYVDVAVADRRVGEVAESLNTIKSETTRLADLLNNYLGMVRPEKEIGTVDLRELARRVIQLVGYTARQSRIEISLQGDEPLPTVRGIPDRLQQAILNLVLNAIQAMPHGGSLALRTEASQGVVRLIVSDTGPGLSQELADQLFDTRVTTKAEGTGLGLPLVRMIVESHGGSVWYRSVPDQGATFTLVLPTDR